MTVRANNKVELRMVDMEIVGGCNDFFQLMQLFFFTPIFIILNSYIFIEKRYNVKQEVNKVCKNIFKSLNFKIIINQHNISSFIISFPDLFF